MEKETTEEYYGRNEGIYATTSILVNAQFEALTTSSVGL